MTEITFERAALYDEVWTTPLTHLGKKYGLSDNGMRKICKALAIPLPRVGHWAKLAAGHDVQREPLPANAERTTFVSKRSENGQPDQLRGEDSWLTERLAFERAPENKIVPAMTPTRWHSAISPLRSQLLAAAKQIASAKREAERRERSPRARTEPNWGAMELHYYLNSGHLLLNTHKSLPARVSEGTLDRAVVILNAIAVEAERRGFHASVSNEKGRMQLEGFGETVELRIAERLEEKPRKKEHSWERDTQKEPTGKLRLFVGGMFAETQIEDGEQILEEKLNRVFETIYRKVASQKEKARRQEEQHKLWVAEQQERERILAAQRKIELDAQTERRNRRALLLEARRWRDATLIREYVRCIASNSSGAESLDIASWTRWANVVADELDPTVPRLRATASLSGVREPSWIDEQAMTAGGDSPDLRVRRAEESMVRSRHPDD